MNQQLRNSKTIAGCGNDTANIQSLKISTVLYPLVYRVGQQTGSTARKLVVLGGGRGWGVWQII